MSEDRILYLEIFQPFAQYRNPFTFYYAQTYPLPPKSTIIGMLQNALDDWYGHKRGVDEWWKLKVSVHGGFESVFWNYQQLIKGDVELRTNGGNVELWNQKRPLYGQGLKSQRTPVYQQELFNGRLFIFIRGDKEFITGIKAALQKPKKILSLGRSEDVIFIQKVKIVEPEEAKPVNKSLWMTYPTYIMKETKENEERKEFPIKNKRYPVYSIPLKVVFKNKNKPIKNKAEITKNTERKPIFATVVHSTYQSVIYLKEEIEVERIEVGDKTFKIPVKWGWLHE